MSSFVRILMLNTFAHLNNSDLKSINDTFRAVDSVCCQFNILSVKTAVNCHFYLFTLSDTKELLNNFITERVMCVLFVCVLALKRRN